MLITLFTLSGPVIGCLGHYLQSDVMFWIGTLIAGANLVLNLISGSMKFPILPLIFTVIGVAVVSPWYLGAALGLLAWTALEGIGEVLSRLREN